GPFTATLAPSPDGRKLFSASWGDADITVWDPATATGEAKLTGHKGNIVRLELTPDGNALVSVGSDGTIRVWDANKLSEIRVLHSDKTAASPALAFSPDSKRVLACCNNKLHLWDLRSGDEIATKQGNHLFAAKFAPDGSHIVGA